MSGNAVARLDEIEELSDGRRPDSDFDPVRDDPAFKELVG